MANTRRTRKPRRNWQGRFPARMQSSLCGLQGFHAGYVQQGADHHAIVRKRNHQPRPHQEGHFGVADFVFLPVGQAYFKRLERLPPQQLSHGFVIHRIRLSERISDLRQSNYTTGIDVFDGWRDDVLTGSPPTFYPIASAGALAQIKVGARGFEPPTSWSQTRRASQTAPRPESVSYAIVAEKPAESNCRDGWCS